MKPERDAGQKDERKEKWRGSRRFPRGGERKRGQEKQAGQRNHAGILKLEALRWRVDGGGYLKLVA